LSFRELQQEEAEIKKVHLYSRRKTSIEADPQLPSHSRTFTWVSRPKMCSKTSLTAILSQIIPDFRRNLNPRTKRWWAPW